MYRIAPDDIEVREFDIHMSCPYVIYMRLKWLNYLQVFQYFIFVFWLLNIESSMLYYKLEINGNKISDYKIR